MQPADIGRLAAAGDPRVSPDGQTVAFTVTTVDLDANEYRSSIWTASVDASSPPRQFTSGEHKDTVPRWSPDGQSIAFVRHKEDGKEAEIRVIPAGGGEARLRATWKDEVRDLAWSPDGSRLAFTARQRDEERYGQEKEKDQPPRRITKLWSRFDSVGWLMDRPNLGPRLRRRPVHRRRRGESGACAPHGDGAVVRPTFVQPGRLRDRTSRCRRPVGATAQPGRCGRSSRWSAAPADDRPRPQLRAVPGCPRSGVGRQRSAVRGRGQRQRSPVPRAGERCRQAGAGRRR
jgi:dipeptidyl aminopeptidase/acylaminoacyl peptidase